MLHQRVAVTFGEPFLARRYESVTTVRCPDCSFRFVAGFEHGEPHGLLDVDGARAQLLDHARRDAGGHPSLFPPAIPERRSA